VKYGTAKEAYYKREREFKGQEVQGIRNRRCMLLLDINMTFHMLA